MILFIWTIFWKAWCFFDIWVEMVKYRWRWYCHWLLPNRQAPFSVGIQKLARNPLPLIPSFSVCMSVRMKRNSNISFWLRVTEKSFHTNNLQLLRHYQYFAKFWKKIMLSPMRTLRGIVRSQSQYRLFLPISPQVRDVCRHCHLSSSMLLERHLNLLSIHTQIPVYMRIVLKLLMVAVAWKVSTSPDFVCELWILWFLNLYESSTGYQVNNYFCSLSDFYLGRTLCMKMLNCIWKL